MPLSAESHPSCHVSSSGRTLTGSFPKLLLSVGEAGKILLSVSKGRLLQAGSTCSVLYEQFLMPSIPQKKLLGAWVSRAKSVSWLWEKEVSPGQWGRPTHLGWGAVLGTKWEFLPRQPVLFISICCFQGAWEQACSAVSALFVYLHQLYFSILVAG